MHAGGTTFWIALFAAVLMAMGSSWMFLSSGTESGFPVTLESAEQPDYPSLEEEVEQALEEGTPDVEADVTFSFAQEVARFADGSYLEQDDLFRTACRSADGGVVWERELDAPVLAAVRLDANDDGPLEYLLVDSRQGIGLDPGGRPIPGFIIRPSSPITSFAVVDYEGDGQERYLFGLADGRVLNYRNLGEVTPGWRHESKGSPVQAIAHLRAGKKDYICTVDEAGVVMLLKRNGQRRVRTPVQLHRQSSARAVAFDVRSDIESSVIISRNAEGAAESRTFGSGVAQTASPAEAQLLEQAESMMPSDRDGF